MGEILTIMSLPVVIAIGVCLQKGYLKALGVIFSIWMICIFVSAFYIVSHTPKMSEEEKACKLLQFTLKDEYRIFTQSGASELKRDVVLQQIKEIQEHGYDCSKYF